MTLVELHVDLARVADALEKIVFLLEKLVFPPPLAEIKIQQATLDDLHVVTPEDQVRIREEQMAFAELRRVLPGSPAFERELIDWEAQQRSLHGEKWQAPDWAAAFISAVRGSVREPAETAASAGQRSPA